MILSDYIPSDEEAVDALASAASGQRDAMLDIAINRNIEAIFDRVYNSMEVLQSDEDLLIDELDALRVERAILKANGGEFPDDDDDLDSEVLELEDEEEEEEEDIDAMIDEDIEESENTADS